MTKYQKKERREKIKNIALAIAFVLVVIQALWLGSHYSKSGMVWETGTNSITVRFADGEMCSVSTNKDFDRFEKVSVIFDTNGTEDRFDDKIIKVK